MSGRSDAVQGLPRGYDPEWNSGIGPGPIRGSHTSVPGWPLSDSFVVAALPISPACARLHGGAVLREWGLANVAETAELVISELVTNAATAAIDPEARLGNAQSASGVPLVRLRLLSDAARVVIEVWDTNPLPPVVTKADPDDESGRGLMLVDALCEHWGWTVPDGWCGKAVWAEISTAT
jgi:anti-sigma regulatory factor (Ser/Thr protein kinase)